MGVTKQGKLRMLDNNLGLNLTTTMLHKLILQSRSLYGMLNHFYLNKSYCITKTNKTVQRGFIQLF